MNQRERKQLPDEYERPGWRRTGMRIVIGLWMAVVTVAISSAPGGAQPVPVTLFRKGVISMDAKVTALPGSCEVLGADTPEVFAGTMEGAFGKQPVEIDVYAGTGVLTDTSFNCHSYKVSICTPASDPLSLLILSDLSICLHTPEVKTPPNDVVGGWQLDHIVATSNPLSSPSDAWGTLTGTDANPGTVTEMLKLRFAATVQFGP